MNHDLQKKVPIVTKKKNSRKQQKKNRRAAEASRQARQQEAAAAKAEELREEEKAELAEELAEEAREELEDIAANRESRRKEAEKRAEHAKEQKAESSENAESAREQKEPAEGVELAWQKEDMPEERKEGVAAKWKDLGQTVLGLKLWIRIVAIVLVVVLALGLVAYGYFHSKYRLMNISDGKFAGTEVSAEGDSQDELENEERRTISLMLARAGLRY